MDVSGQTDEVYQKIETGQQELTTIKELSEQTIEASKEMQSNMDELFNIINHISSIISGIDNISMQTNLLALNASVEAARAGETGKGFAVVANEVRELASKSDQATKATMELIHRSIEAVNNGGKAVTSVTASVSRVVNLAGQAAEQMDLMARAVDRQTGSIDQVYQAVSQISEVVQSNSATAEESAATSEELSNQAEVLKQLVGSFTLRRR